MASSRSCSTPTASPCRPGSRENFISEAVRFRAGICTIPNALNGSVSDRSRQIPSARIYKSGDLAQQNPDGTWQFLGRVDDQVKVRGFPHRTRRDRGRAWRGIRPSNRRRSRPASRPPPETVNSIAGYLLRGSAARAQRPPTVRGWLRSQLPDYFVPARLAALERLPVTPSGKLDRRKRSSRLAMEESLRERVKPSPPPRAPRPETHGGKRSSRRLWKQVLGRGTIGRGGQFFRRGWKLHFRRCACMHSDLSKLSATEFPDDDVFFQRPDHPRAGGASCPNVKQARWRVRTADDAQRAGSPAATGVCETGPPHDRWLDDKRRLPLHLLHMDSIAIIGMSGRFPGCGKRPGVLGKSRAVVSSRSPDLPTANWRCARPDGRGQTHSSMRAWSRPGTRTLFDAGFFSFNAREAELLDPQHRVFLECAWEALESAGHDAGAVSWADRGLGGFGDQLVSPVIQYWDRTRFFRAKLVSGYQTG